MRVLTSCATLVAMLCTGGQVWANMSYSPWIHRLVQEGQDVAVTVNIFEDASWDTYNGVPFPSFEVAYSLERWGLGAKWLFEDRVFDKTEAESVSDYECQLEDEELGLGPGLECKDDPSGCDDCDGDGVAECPSHRFCAVAYRFTVIDECVPPSMPGGAGGLVAYYHLTSRELEEASQEFYDYEGFGHENFGIEDTGDPCLDSDSGGEGPGAAEGGAGVEDAGTAGTDAEDDGVAGPLGGISSESDEDTDDGGGCSVSAVGRPATRTAFWRLLDALI